jgi:hypothetical protein
MQIRINLILLFLAILNISHAQSIEYNGLPYLQKNNFGTLIENNALTGYYTFNFVEKADNQNITYSVDFYDINLIKLAGFEIVRNKKSRFIETAFNQDAIILMFYEGKALELVTYDRNGKEIGSKIIRDLPHWETMKLDLSTKSVSEKNISLFTIGKTGFVRLTYTKGDKDGYAIEAYNNEIANLWTYASSPESKMLEFCGISYCSDKYIGLYIIKYKSMVSSSPGEHYFVMLDAQTGKEYYTIPLDAKMPLLISSIDDKSGQTILVGEYYLPEDKVLKDESQGIYIRTIANDGSELMIKKNSWSNELASAKKNINNLENKEKNKQLVERLLFNKIIKSENGHIYCIGEQLLRPLARFTKTYWTAKLTHIAILEFDENLELVDFSVVAKRTAIITDTIPLSV